MEKGPSHIVIIRFSAIGDVAIAAPLVLHYAVNNPQVKFTVVSTPFLAPLFKGVDNISFIGADFKGKHRGFKGLLRLFREIKRGKPTHIADLHGVLRSFVLDALFKLTLIPVKIIDKGRSAKHALVRRDNKIMRELPSSISRYERVLNSCGLAELNFSLQKGRLRSVPLTSTESGSAIKSSSKRIIGIAPFAKHKGKMWPDTKMEEVIAALSDDTNNKILLFGGGKREILILKSWEQKYSGVESVAGKLSLSEELELIAGLDVMICMDSANMHFASYAGTPVISIWGATHPFAGFYGFGQSLDNAIQLDLECRPCSVFGNKPCFRGDYACLNNIETSLVIEKIQNFLSQNGKKRD